MKKILLMFLAGALSFCFIGCSSGSTVGTLYDARSYTVSVTSIDKESTTIVVENSGEEPLSIGAFDFSAYNTKNGETALWGNKNREYDQAMMKWLSGVAIIFPGETVEYTVDFEEGKTVNCIVFHPGVFLPDDPLDVGVASWSK